MIKGIQGQWPFFAGNRKVLRTVIPLHAARCDFKSSENPNWASEGPEKRGVESTEGWPFSSYLSPFLVEVFLLRLSLKGGDDPKSALFASIIAIGHSTLVYSSSSR